MASMAELEAIVASIGVEAKESEVRFRRKMEEFTKGLEASRVEFDRRLAEADKRRAEADRAFAASRAEADKRQAEADKRQAEADKRQAEADKRQAEADKRQAALDERIDKMCAKVGGIDENIGHHAEQFFQDAIAETLTFGGEKYDFIHKNFQSSDKKINAEFDILLVNGQSVAIIEVKNRIHPNFVERIATEKIAKFRRFFPQFKNHKAYLGIAGFSFCKEVLDKAQKFGVGIIKQVGDSVEIDAGHLKAY